MAKMSLSGRGSVGAQSLEYLANDILSTDATTGRQQIDYSAMGKDLRGNSPGLGFPPRTVTDIRLTIVRPDGSTVRVTHDGTNEQGLATFVGRENGAGSFSRFRKVTVPKAKDHILIDRG